MKTTLPLAFACAAFLTALSAAAQQPAQPPDDPELQQGISLDLQGKYRGGADAHQACRRHGDDA